MQGSDLLTTIFRLTPRQTAALERLGLETVEDLLRYLPARFGRELPVRTIAELAKGDDVTIYGQVMAAKTAKAWRKKIPLGELTLADQTGEIKAVWFHQPYLAKKVPVGRPARLSGKVAEKSGKLYLANPEIEPADRPGGESLFAAGADPARPAAVYPESGGLSSSWFRYHIERLLAGRAHEQIVDPLPAAILKKYHLPALADALILVHEPKTERDALAARKRFAFEEIFLIQLGRLQAKADYASRGAPAINADERLVDDFVAHLPFKPTGAQTRAIRQILSDLGRHEPMLRLLEGDVGSGKTAVAATTAAAVVAAGYQVAYLAPTEILARQHFDSFIKNFAHQPIQIGLITGAGCYKFPSKINPRGATDISRSQLLKWVANGEIPILVGTHALIQKTVRFKKLGYAIIDEQHRFGVNQRAALARQASSGASPTDRFRAPHLLSMTATPIPRTLALTLYGDLDLSLLDELPAGRRPIITRIVSETGRASAYEAIRQELAAGRQAYVICPRIDEPDPTKELALQTKSAKAEAKRLQEKIFPNDPVGLVYSKLKPAEKEKVMAEFAAGQIKILVATSVVEVGVNVPNATVILIEGAERFGLAQLHQLRGRVFRSSHQAYCYLFTSNNTKSPTALKRLQALGQAKNGFELAELDLAQRGAGQLGGTKQWGLSDVGMEAIKNLKMVEAARLEARALISTDPELKSFPTLAQRLKNLAHNYHFE